MRWLDCLYCLYCFIFLWLAIFFRLILSLNSSIGRSRGFLLVYLVPQIFQIDYLFSLRLFLSASLCHPLKLLLTNFEGLLLLLLAMIIDVEDAHPDFADLRGLLLTLSCVPQVL